jgi:HK97 gp10 family phage protein
MAVTFVQVFGAKALIDNLSDFGAQIQYGAAQRMALHGAKLFQAEVKKRVPVQTGQLQRSIRVVKLHKSWAPLIEYAVTAYSGEKYGKENDGWYAHIVEFGSGPYRTGGISKRTSRFKRAGGTWLIGPRQDTRYKSGRIRSYGSGRRAISIGGNVVSQVIHTGARPKPFFRPAWHESKHAILYAMKNELAKSVKRYQQRAVRGISRITYAA